MSQHNPIVQVLVEHVNRGYEKDSDEIKDGDESKYGNEIKGGDESKESVESWRRLPEIPATREILGPVHSDSDTDDDTGEDLKDSHRLNLPNNIVDKAWCSAGEYIGTHYQLLREDAVAPLRQAVALYRSFPAMKDNTDLSIYTHVYIVGMTFSNLGPAPRIEFSYERAGKQIRWKQSKRLQQGTIVALSPVHDKFKAICKVAVVAARPLQGVEQNPPQIDLFWGDDNEADFDPLQEYVMIEAKSGYFEASRHMLVAMQKLMTESFPLSDHLVYLNKSIGAPDFVERQPLADLNSLKPKNKGADNHPEKGPILVEEDNSLDNVNILDRWPTIKGAKLDESQLAALRRILTKKLAVVQGPPGTGKTFVSISALSVMLDNLRPSDPPIIVAAQTNHALDQLLSLIAPVEPNFLRLGGRTSEDNVVVKERTLYEVRSKTTNIGGVARYGYKIARNSLETASQLLQLNIEKAVMQGDNEAEILLELNLISQEQYESLFDEDWVSAQDPELPPGIMALWLGREQLATPPKCPPINMCFRNDEDLEFEALEEVEAETGKRDDDDIDMLNGRWYPFKELYTGIPSTGYSDKKLKKLLHSNSNLWEIPPTIRGEIYRYLRRQLKAIILKVFRGHLIDYQRSVRNLKIARWQSDATLIKTSRIKLIGCTTTGLSKYRGLLASLRPRTMLIEEAAETLELAAMFDSLKQLVLVGDHQQLQAHCNVSALQRAPYNLAVSMFERLVNNGVEYTMLNKQRRMISEIRELLDPFYPNLQDHSSVLDRVENRKPIPGMGGRDSYFFHHQWPESRDDSLSRFNVHEADMIAYFFTYLVLNGVKPSQVTVLTFYSGQRKVVLQKLRRQPELAQLGHKFNVFTVDSYQGEENDIILLSLVRSNGRRKIGFLENKNRAVVSLSRARRGLYIFGNSINLLAANTESFKLWSTITDRFRIQGRLNIYSGLPIVCQNHQIETLIREPDDWVHITGGCGQKCDALLPCGHSCPYKCHQFSHRDIFCNSACRAVLPCGHACSEKCGSECKCKCTIHLPQSQAVVDKVQDEFWQLSLDQVLGDSPTKIEHIQAVADKFQDEFWQLSLDQVLGDSAAKNEHAHDERIENPIAEAFSKTASDQSNIDVTPTSTSAQSSPRRWREWDPVKADKALMEIQRASDAATANTSAKFPILNDTHRPVTILNGSRVKVKKETSSNGLRDGVSAEARNRNSSHQPVGSIKTPIKLKSNQRSSAGKRNQLEIESGLLSSEAVNKNAHSKQITKMPSLLDLELVSLSPVDAPMHLPRYGYRKALPNQLIGTHNLSSISAEDLIAFD